MTIRHHLAEDLVLAYAAGSLSEGWSLAVATHLALCPQCRTRYRAAEAIGGALLDELQDDALADSAWAAVRKRLSASERAASNADRAGAHRTAVLPEPLRSRVGGDLQSVQWRALGRGAYHVPIPTRDGETQARLLRIPAGQPVPEHSHGGRELTLVLTGSFYDGAQIFQRGDIEDADESLMHQPIASAEADCICLAVTEAPLRFKSWMVRLVQPFIGI